MASSTTTTTAAPVSAAQLAEHTKASDCWMAIEGKVYNVTDFVDEHPGGDEVLLAEAGKDATDAFNDVGHSEDARQLLEPMLVGSLAESAKSGPTPEVKTAPKQSSSGPSPVLMFLPVGLLLAWYGYQYYTGQLSSK